MTPQIEIDSPLGKFLTEQAALASTVVEIGTGGGGSTLCLFKGLQEGARLITVEADRNTYLEAIEKLPSSIMFMNGVLHREVTDYGVYPLPRPEVFEMWQRESVLAATAPIIESFLPEQIDLLLLDGGEFTTFGDYKLLKNRCKVIVIDDCNYEVALKTAAIYSILKSDPAWECIADHRLNRNGWAAFRRKGV
jgi:hypothetical protein